MEIISAVLRYVTVPPFFIGRSSACFSRSCILLSAFRRYFISIGLVSIAAGSALESTQYSSWIYSLA